MAQPIQNALIEPNRQRRTHVVIVARLLRSPKSRRELDSAHLLIPHFDSQRNADNAIVISCGNTLGNTANRQAADQHVYPPKRATF
jgi:hypothetical protein